jgi:hypothetical protein
MVCALAGFRYSGSLAIHQHLRHSLVDHSMVHWIEPLCAGALLVQWAKAYICYLLGLRIEHLRKKKYGGLHYSADRARWVVGDSENGHGMEIDGVPEEKPVELILVKNWSCFD